MRLFNAYYSVINVRLLVLIYSKFGQKCLVQILMGIEL